MKLISAALAVVLLAATTALGDVIPRHDPSIVTPPGGFVTGTGNLLYDTETNLEWLDVTVTLGRSFPDVVGDGTPGAVALVPGFRYASRAEAFEFFAHAGLVVPNYGATSVEDSIAMTAIQQEWGVTFDNPESLRAYTHAWVSDPLPPGSAVGAASAVTLENTNGGTDQILPPTVGFPYGFNPDPADTRGSALVRDAVVPEPSSYALAGMAFVVVGAWASIRRRSKRPHGSPLPSVPSA